MSALTPSTPINNPTEVERGRPGVLFAPESVDALRRGFTRVADVLALTLGPRGGNVVVEHAIDRRPELLTDAAAIARRVVELPNRAEDAGAMLMRHLVWRMHERAGDGAATVAVMAHALLREASRLRAGGADPVALTRGVEHGASEAALALDALARPVRGLSDIRGMAHAITGEAGLSDALGELYYNLGADAHVILEEYAAPYLQRSYVDGGRWVAKLASPYFYTHPGAKQALIEDCAVALCAGDVAAFDDVAPMLELIAQLPEERRAVAVFAHGFSGDALNTLVANHRAGRARIAAIDLRRAGAEREADFDDLAALTGATVYGPDRGAGLGRLSVAGFGRAGRVEATHEACFVSGGAGRAARMDAHVRALESRLRRLDARDASREEVRQRIARLVGRVAYLRIGAHTNVEREVLRAKAEKAIRALPLGLNEGLAPGGGSALVHCAAAVRGLGLKGEEGWGAEALARALEAPFEQIVRNSGEPSARGYMAQVRARKTLAYDAISRSVRPAAKAGVIDPAGVLRAAIETAVSGAMMALTVEAIVLRRATPVSSEP